MNFKTVRSIFLAAITAAPLLPAQAELPEEAWWQQDHGSLTINGTTLPMRATLGMHIDGQQFCGVAAFSAIDENVWVVRGHVVDGRLVQDSRTLVRGSVAMPASDARLPVGGPSVPPVERVTTTDYFVLPNSLVSRETARRTRGEFDIHELLPSAPSAALWLDLAWHCSDEGGVDKLAEAEPTQ